jgi:predicted enzyme related to lactoylglutathione lyase
MSMPAQVGLVLDCTDPEALAEFWAPAIGCARLGAAGNHVLLVPEGGSGPRLLLQQVPEPKTAKNRMHLDIEIPDIEAEAARLEGPGARRVHQEPQSEFGSCWIVMSDPAGNEFCVCDGGEGTT